MNVFVLDIDDYPATNRIREEPFAEFGAPASTLVEVSGFVRPDVRVEIECTVAIPENATVSPRIRRSCARFRFLTSST
jgi:enamine deaminase RidA (YjgF/YER057c/UK114 family)